MVHLHSLLIALLKENLYKLSFQLKKKQKGQKKLSHTFEQRERINDPPTPYRKIFNVLFKKKRKS